MSLKSFKFNDMLRERAKRLSLLGVLCLALGLSSCESIYDDDPNCLQGIALRFVYDYHMEPGANAFAANVDCINVFVFDEAGNYVKQFKETSDVLRNDWYRMNIPLESGKYQLIVYGGLACEHSRFSLTPDWLATPTAKKEDIRVTLPRNAQGESDVRLHEIVERPDGILEPTGGLFYGTLEVEVTEDDYNTTYREETVHLMNDVNNIRIILQELDYPKHVDYRDYDFKIIDDNFVLDSNNNPVHMATADNQPVYVPYVADNIPGKAAKNVGSNGVRLEEDEKQDIQLACVEFSTSRLLAKHWKTARLVITSKTETDKNGNPATVMDILLMDYLLAAQGFGDTWIKSDQEYLDRQSRWTLMLFLQHGYWAKLDFVVNDWTIHVENIDF